MKKRLHIFLLINLVLFSCKERKEEIKKTEPNEVLKTFNKPVPDNDNGGLFLPNGFGALVVVDSIGPSRHLAVNKNGDIYVKLREPKGQLGNMALRDTTQNGKADIIKRFGNYPNDGTFGTEMRIHNGYLYFSSELVIYRQKLSEINLIPEGNPEVVLTDQYPVRWHNAKSLAFDGVGGMYVTFSAPTNACEDSESSGKIKGLNPCPGLDVLGSIWRFDENRLNQTQYDGENFAIGIRSIVGISWNHLDNSLYAVQHGRDYLHNHAPESYSKWENAVLPAEEFMRIEKGDNFGWPYSYYDPFKKKRLVAPEYGGNGKTIAEGYKDPLMGFPAHWAPNDLLFYQGSMFPERYKNGAFVAFHGSTNRGPYPQAGYIIAFTPFENGIPTGDWEVFADGFTGTDIVVDMQDARFRPMGLAEGPDGSLYISESKQGKIWRIMFDEDKKYFDKTDLLEMEKRKNRSYIRRPDRVNDLVGKS